MSLTDEQINGLNFDETTQNHIDSSKGVTTVTTTAHLTSATQSQQTITASVPQLTTTAQLSSNFIEKSRQALEVRSIDF